MTRRAIVCDTTLLLYLGRIDRTDLLRDLFAPVYVPEAVLLELDMGRLIRRDTIEPRELDWVEIVPVSQALLDRLPPSRLGTGERAVISYAHAHHIDLAGLDDLRARQLAEKLDLAVVGTLGVLLRAKRAALIPTIRPLVDALIAQGFRMGSNLYHDVLEIAQEDVSSR